MNKIFISAVAGVAVGYFVRKIQSRAHTMEMCGDRNNGNQTTKNMDNDWEEVINRNRSLSDSIQAE